MSNKTIFSFADSPYVFSWVKGSKIVNIFDKSDGLMENCLYNVSFAHHKSSAIKADAKRSIKHWRDDNE